MVYGDMMGYPTQEEYKDRKTSFENRFKDSKLVSIIPSLPPTPEPTRERPFPILGDIIKAMFFELPNGDLLKIKAVTEEGRTFIVFDELMKIPSKERIKQLDEDVSMYFKNGSDYKNPKFMDSPILKSEVATPLIDFVSGGDC